MSWWWQPLLPAALTEIAADLGQTLGDASLASEADLAIAAEASNTAADASVSAAATLAIAADLARTLDELGLDAAAALAIAAQLSITLDAATLSAEASTGAPIDAELEQTLGVLELSADATVPQPDQPSQAAGGSRGVVFKGRRKKSFIGTRDRPLEPELPRRRLDLEMTLEDCSLSAEAVVRESARARLHRRTLAVLFSG